jgi:hypothetical protein
MGIHSKKPSKSLSEEKPIKPNLDKLMIDILNLLFNENEHPSYFPSDVSTGFGNKSSTPKYHGLKQNRIGESLGIKSGSISVVSNALTMLKKYELIEYASKKPRKPDSRGVFQITAKGIVTFKELRGVFIKKKEQNKIVIPKFLNSCSTIDQEIRAKDMQV